MRLKTEIWGTAGNKHDPPPELISRIPQVPVGFEGGGEERQNKEEREKMG